MIGREASSDRRDEWQRHAIPLAPDDDATAFAILVALRQRGVENEQKRDGGKSRKKQG